MSYFTETLEETMSMLEFKGDSEMAYANRRAYEQGTHDRSKGKKKSNVSKRLYNSNSHYGSGYDKGLDAKEVHDFNYETSKQNADYIHKKLDFDRMSRVNASR